MRRLFRHRSGRLLGGLVLTALIYWANVSTSPEVRLGILYLIPVMLATWYDGWRWGVTFAAGTIVLREVVASQQMPADTSLTERVVNLLTYILVAGGFVIFLTRLRGVQGQLEDLATTDSLTRMCNRRTFSDRVAAEIQRRQRYGGPLSLLYLDLDDFKRVNDLHGHLKGDAVLRLVADAIQAAVRPVDLVGRIGGDEFAILLPETDGTGARAAAQRLSLGIASAFRGSPSVTASIGVVSAARADFDTDEILSRADRAMYDAKAQGKNRVVEVTL